MSQKCYYCERKFDIAVYGTNAPLAKTRDHIVPLVKNGSSKKENFVDACSGCNRIKNDMLLPEFALYLEKRIIKYLVKNTNVLYPIHILERMLENTKRLILEKQHVAHLLFKKPKKTSVISGDTTSKRRVKRKSKTKKSETERIIWKDRGVTPVYAGGTVPTFKPCELTNYEWLHKYNLEPEPNFHYED